MEVSLQQLFDLLQFDVALSNDHQLFPPTSFQTYYLPPGTTFRLDESNEHSRRLTFENKFIKLSLTFRQASSSVGIGEYAEVFGLDQMDTGNSTFRVITEVTQKWLLNGHPKMDAQRKWADILIDGILRDFSYEQIRAGLVEDWLFIKSWGHAVFRPTCPR